MEDRFKFRFKADGIDHFWELDYNLGRDIVHEYSDVILINPFDFWNMALTHNGRLEQCTGLRDKNGNLIYEGDWILVGGKYKRYIIWDKKEARFTSKYEDGQTAGFIYNEKDVDYKLEIIGNIHQPKGENYER